MSANWKFEFPHGPVYSNKDANGNIMHAGYAHPDALSLNNGNLIMTQTRVSTPFVVNGDEYHFMTGAITSKLFENSSAPYYNDEGLLYGLYEIRCKIPEGCGITPAFWLTGSHMWPPEIDVFEVDHCNKSKFFSSVHVVNPANNCAVYFQKSYNLSADFHTFSCSWTPTQISFYLDGNELYTIDNPYDNHPYWISMNMIANLGVWYNDNQNNGRQFIIDYIKVYKQKNNSLLGENGPPNVAGDLAWSDSRKIAFYKGTDNKIHNTFWNSWSQPIGFWDHGVVKWDAPANVAGDLVWSESRQILFYRGIDNKVYHIFWNTWSQSYGFWDYGVVKWDAPANVVGNLVWSESFKALYYKGDDNKVHHIFWDTWTYSYGYWDYRIVNPSAPDNVSGDLELSDSRQVLFYKGFDNKVHHIFYDSWSQSTGFWDYGVVKWDAPANVAGEFAWSESRHTLFYKGIDNKIYNIFWNTSNQSYGFWDFAQLQYSIPHDVNINSTLKSDLLWAEDYDKLLYLGTEYPHGQLHIDLDDVDG